MNRGLAAKLAAICGAYIVMTLPASFIGIALPALYRQGGGDLKYLAFLYLPMLPWSFKFLWAHWVDRYHIPRFPRRKQWILGSAFVSMTLFAGLALLPPDEQLMTLVVAVTVLAFFASTQDTATDAYTTESLTARERGWGNGIQTSGFYLGSLIGGAGILGLYSTTDWATAVLTAVATCVASLIPIAVRKEPSSPKPCSDERERPHFRRFLARREAVVILTIVALTKFAVDFISLILSPFLVDQGFTLGGIGAALGLWGTGAAIAGALVGGLIVSAVGTRRSLSLFLLLLSVSAAGIALWLRLGDSNRDLLVAALSLTYALKSCVVVALFTQIMDWCSPAQTATDYTCMQCGFQLAGFAAGSIAGISAASLGYFAHFGAASIVAAAAALLAPALFALAAKRGASAFVVSSAFRPR